MKLFEMSSATSLYTVTADRVNEFSFVLIIFIQDQSMAPPARVRLLPVSQED